MKYTIEINLRKISPYSAQIYLSFSAFIKTVPRSRSGHVFNWIYLNAPNNCRNDR